MDVHQLHVQKLPSAHIVRLQKVIRLCTAQCKMLLFHAKTTMRESCNFWRNKEKFHFSSLVTLWFGTFKMLFHILRVLLVMNTLWYIVIKAY